MINGKLRLLRGTGYSGSHLRELPNVVAAPAAHARSEPFCPTKKGGAWMTLWPEYSSFVCSTKTNISKFQFDLDGRPA